MPSIPSIASKTRATCFFPVLFPCEKIDEVFPYSETERVLREEAKTEGSSKRGAVVNLSNGRYGRHCGSFVYFKKE